MERFEHYIHSFFLNNKIFHERGRTIYHASILTGEDVQCKNVRYDGNNCVNCLGLSVEIRFFSPSLDQLNLILMETNTFSLDEIRRELARLGYDGLSKQTLVKFQQDLDELAQNDKTQSINQKFVYSSIGILFSL